MSVKGTENIAEGESLCVSVFLHAGFWPEKGKVVLGMGVHGKKKISLKNITPITSWIADVMNIFTSLPSLPSIIALIFKNSFIAGISIIICIVVLCGCFLCQVVIKRIERSNNKKISEERNCGKHRAREYICKNLLIQKWQRKIAFLMTVCIIFGVLNGYNLYKFTGESGNGNEIESGSKGRDMNIETVHQEEEETISYDMISNISFCLNEAEVPRLGGQDAEKIFYVLYQGGGNFVKEHIEELNSVRKMSGIGKLTDGEKESIAKASAAEINFKNKVEKAKSLKSKRQMKKWQETVPDVTDYKADVIEKRVIIIDSEKDNGDICFLVANDFQYIGNEYKEQDEDYKAVIYYWGQCIIYTEKSLAYRNLSEKIRKDRCEYLKMRYKDIADYIEKNWDKIGDEDKEMYGRWRDAAREIYDAM